MLLNTFKKHSDRVVSVAFTSDNQFLASASYDNTVKIWNPVTGEIFRSFSVESINQNNSENHYLSINSSSKISFSKDNKVITLGNGHNSLISWHIDTGEVVLNFKGRSDYTLGTVFSPDGELFANTMATGEINIWQVKTGKLQDTIANTGIITTMVFSNDNNFLASIDTIGKIQFWNLKSKKSLNQWQGFRTVGLSANAEFIATNKRNIIKVWNLQTSEEVYTFEDKFNYLQAFLFSPNNEMLVSADAASNKIILWNLVTNEKIQTLRSPQVYSIAMSTNGKMIASANFDNTVKIWGIQ